MSAVPGPAQPRRWRPCQQETRYVRSCPLYLSADLFFFFFFFSLFHIQIPTLLTLTHATRWHSSQHSYGWMLQASAHLASTAAGWENGGGRCGDDHPADHSDHSDLPYPPAMVDNSKGPSRRVSGELPRRIGLDDGVNVEVPENRRDHYQVTSAAVSLLPPISLTML